MGSRRASAANKRGKPRPKPCQPDQQEPEVVADGGEHGIGGVAGAPGEVVAAHAVVLLEMANHRLHGRPAAELALDLGGDATLLCGCIDARCLRGRRIVTAIAGIGDDAGQRGADLLTDRRKRFR